MATLLERTDVLDERAEISKVGQEWRRDPRLAACLVATILLLTAAFHENGDAFYTFLRIYVCGAAAVLAFVGWREGRIWWSLSAIMLAILFNPVQPIEMYRDDWFWYDVAAATWFGAVGGWTYLRAHLKRHNAAWGGAAVALFILAIFSIPTLLRLSSPTRNYSDETMNVDADASLFDMNAVTNADDAAFNAADVAAAPSDPLGDAFEAATGHRKAFTEIEGDDVVTTKPVRIIDLPFGPALLTTREIKDGCHACSGALGVFYLRQAGGKTTVVGSWPKAVEGWGWGAPPTKWNTTDKFTAFPAIYASGGFMGQGVVEESATLTELRPTGPVTSDVIGTGFSDEGAIVDNERPACIVKGTITNIRRDRSFDVVSEGSVRTVDHYVKKNGKFVATSKIDWGVPCDS